MLYAIFCTDKPGRGTVRGANRQAHLDYLAGFKDQIVIAGPLQNDAGDGMVGSLLVLDFPDRAAAEAFAADDPYAKADLFESVVIRRWKQVFPQAS